ncbi:hypothetical protein QT397_25535 [Microbulbifer sp. MKSA007]|nr:hypothetical protein QT397_25535 [Microbulbifer sp. MKSA007]
MSAGNSFTRFETLFPHKPPGQRVNRVVVSALTLILSAILFTLWLYLFLSSQEKSYVEQRGYRLANEETFNKFLREGSNRSSVQALNQLLRDRGVAEVFPIRDLLRQGGLAGTGGTPIRHTTQGPVVQYCENPHPGTRPGNTANWPCHCGFRLPH